MVLLDNMPPPVLREAVALVAGRVPTEASGGVRLDTIHAIAETGVTYVWQPGGSTRADEVVAAADEHDMVMTFSGLRLFHH